MVNLKKERKMKAAEFTDEDMADVGRAFMEAFEHCVPKGWHPMDCPTELLGHFRDECEDMRRDAERYRKLRDEDAWGEDTSESGGSRWMELGELHGHAFDAFVDALPSNSSAIDAGEWKKHMKGVE